MSPCVWGKKLGVARNTSGISLATDDSPSFQLRESGGKPGVTQHYCVRHDKTGDFGEFWPQGLRLCEELVLDA